MAKYVGAIDQGTTSTRFMLFDYSGKVVGVDQKEHEQIYPKPGWVEHDPEEIFNNLVEAVTLLTGRHAAQKGKIIALSITNQRETFVVFDRETGLPLHNAIVWQCRRGSSSK